MNLITSIITLILLSWNTLQAHQMSEELREILNEPKPEWLSFAKSLKVELVRKIPTEDIVGAIPIKDEFFDARGGAQSNVYEITIPKKGIKHKFNYSISKGDIDGRGISLSPDGTMLIVNTDGVPSRYVYRIDKENKLVEIDLKIPNVTYEDGPKGFIRGWSWVTNDLLIGTSEILHPNGHEVIEDRIYCYSVKSKSIARLKMPNHLDVDNPAYYNIVSIKKDLSQIQVEEPEGVVYYKVDLKAAHVIEKK